MFRGFLLFCLCAVLSACAPYVNAGNKNMVTIYVPHEMFEAEALVQADAHCAQYGLTAILKKPRGTRDQYYDYKCVK
jgi:hypothetical protein